MTDRAAFLRAIRDDPDNDEPRLVYADWLEEQGDPRAEFIRLQCEIAQSPWGPRQNKRIGQLHKRAEKIAKLHRSAWIPWEDRFSNKEWLGVGFQRGFWPSIYLSVEQFIQFGAEILSQEPIYDVVLSANGSQRIAELAAMPEVEAIRHLEVSDTFKDAHLAELLSSPNLRNVRRLLFANSGCRAKCRQVLAEAEFPHLEWLGLVATALKQIPPVERFPKLTHLNVCQNPRVKTIAPIANHPAIEHLSLASTGVYDLSPVATLPKLKALTAGHERLEDLSPLTGLPNLEVVSLNGTRITDLEPLFTLPKLNAAWISRCNAPQEQIDRLAKQLGLHASAGEIRPKL